MIIYSSASSWCNKLSESDAQSSNICSADTYINSTNFLSSIVGKIIEPKFQDLHLRNGVASCADGENGKNFGELCLYDKGRGMKISASGEIIKSEEESFTSFSAGHYSLHHIARSDGSLDFSTSWNIAGNFSLFNQFMSQWSMFSDINSLNQYINNSSAIDVDLAMNFIHAGRYFMEVEIGSGINYINIDSSGIGVEYKISDTTPSDSDTGEQISSLQVFLLAAPAIYMFALSQVMCRAR